MPCATRPRAAGFDSPWTRAAGGGAPPWGAEIRPAVHAAGRQVHLTVADTGPGIAPEHALHVFERFYQADAARSTSNGGSGLGLAIAKGLIEGQQGHIHLESRL